MSIQQDEMLKKIKSVIGEKVYFKTDYRPNWMKNPRTNHNLEIDIYIPKIYLGFEYQGFHHFSHSDKVRFKDSIKNNLAKRKFYACSIVELFEQDLFTEDFKSILIQRVKEQAHKHTYNKFSVLVQQKEFADISEKQYKDFETQTAELFADVDLANYVY